MLKTPEKYMFDGDDTIPNNPVLPVLIYRKAIAKQTVGRTETIKKRFKTNGWAGIWTDTIYTYRHFHTNAHEVLAIAKGKVTLEIGGKTGKVIELDSGDLIILPAGTGHKRLSKEDVTVIGAYPKGQEHYDMCRRIDDCSRVIKEIVQLPLPVSDPFFGKNGPLNKAWKTRKKKSAKKWGPKSP